MRRIIVCLLTALLLLSGCTANVPVVTTTDAPPVTTIQREPVTIFLAQYTWDGWGISGKTVKSCDAVYTIIDELEIMKETGETVPKVSDDVLNVGYAGTYPVDTGTMWLEYDGKIYRMTRDLEQICVVESHFGAGKVLEMTDKFRNAVTDVWQYAPYDYYWGTYQAGDDTVVLENVYKSNSTVKLRVTDIFVEKKDHAHNIIAVELTSTVDQQVTIRLRAYKSSDNREMGDQEILQLENGVPVTVELTFGGWDDRYWIDIEVALTQATIEINP